MYDKYITYASIQNVFFKMLSFDGVDIELLCRRIRVLLQTSLGSNSIFLF